MLEICADDFTRQPYQNEMLISNQVSLIMFNVSVPTLPQSLGMSCLGLFLSDVKLNLEFNFVGL